MKPRRKQSAASRTAAARWLGVIVCLCVGLGAGFVCLISLAQNWGARSSLTYAAISAVAFAVTLLLGRRAAMTHL